MDDRISSLPDEIPSFLQTEYAVRTSVLSRRWKDAWTRVYSLDLAQPYSCLKNTDNHDEIRGRDFQFFRNVGRVLSQHKNLNSLRRFRFHFRREGFLGSKASPNFWSRMMGLSADESQLEEMHVKFGGESYCYYYYIGTPNYIHCLPETFYSLKHLKVLKLKGAMIVTIKGSVLLPSVEMLQLLRVEIKDCESLSRLISGCPVLETLHLEHLLHLERD